jgi:geranylgeranyl diphosphate synthase, type II
MDQEKNVEKILKDLEIHIQQYPYGKEPLELYEPIRYLMGLGGKRIRPLLALMAYKLFKDDYTRILTPALSIEVFHNFTLMHDDIMDNAPLRRGQATVHERWNPNTAILSGDVMLVKAYDMLLETDSQKLGTVIRHFNRVASEVCEGQQLDMNFENRNSVSEEEYINMIRLKTAVLLGFSLQFGAILADAPAAVANQLYEFGVNIGIGFQLKDDLLDVYADKTKFGKQVGGDIIANKKTFLLIKAKELAKGAQAAKLDYWLNLKTFDKAEKVTAVKGIYDELNIQELTEAKMQQYFETGFASLDKLQVPDMEAYHSLKQLTSELVYREK